MDFKSLLNKLDSMDAPVATPKAPELPKSVQLNEDAQLRVLAGTSSILAEAKKMEEEMKVGDKKTTSKGGTIEKTKTGIKHTAGPGVYGGSEAKKDDDDEDAPKSKGSKKAVKEAEDKKAAAKEKFKAMIAKKKEEKKKPVKEAAKPDFLDMDKDGNKKEPMKKAVADKKKGAIKKESVAVAKKVVAEGIEQPKLTFKQMIKLVQESGGQQQIDAVDRELFAWAQRIASKKFTEAAKQEVYAGLVYERMGGVFEMYDVLSEDQK